MKNWIVLLVALTCLSACKSPKPKDSTKVKSRNIELYISIHRDSGGSFHSSETSHVPYEVHLVMEEENGKFVKVNSSSGRDRLDLYINSELVTLTSKMCGGLFVESYFCGYRTQYLPEISHSEPLNFEVVFTRDKGENLELEFTTPAPFELLEPHRPFAPIYPNEGNTLLAWNPDASLKSIEFYGHARDCSLQSRHFNLARNESYLEIGTDLFVARDAPCNQYSRFNATFLGGKTIVPDRRFGFKKVAIDWSFEYYFLFADDITSDILATQ